MKYRHLTNGRPAILALADGTIFKGTARGASATGCTTTGEVVFTTGMTGYQEVLTDPSYAGQIVTMTAPQIGNTGINREDDEGDRPRLKGFVTRELSPTVSNWRSGCSLDEYLSHWGILAIDGVDTRALTRHIRDHGAQNGTISAVEDFSDSTISRLINLAASAPSMNGLDLATAISTREGYVWSEGSGAWKQEGIPGGTGMHVVVMDFGVKKNILRLLVDRGCKVTVIPSKTPTKDIQSLNPDGLFVSNGPGDPAAIGYAIDNLKTLLQTGLPTFGICLGHQLMSLAWGAKTKKLKFGHRGINQPVRDLSTGHVEITTQNHGFVVTDLPPHLTPTHVHLNDNTIEGTRHTSLPAFSIQYHPESGGGPHDSHHLFDKFISNMSIRTGARK